MGARVRRILFTFILNLDLFEKFFFTLGTVSGWAALLGVTRRSRERRPFFSLILHSPKILIFPCLNP